ncbi:hypothetical protein ACROYT_G009719 [Oculina patagonica]
MHLSVLNFPKENHSQFQLQPNEETVEVVDEDKVQFSYTDIGPAEPVSASLVEIVEENGPNLPQKDGFSKRPSETRNSSLSSRISKFPQHKVDSLQTRHRKPRVKFKKQKSATGRPFSSKSKIVTRVSIPGKHRLFNISQFWSNWMKLLNSSRKSSSLRHNTYGGSTFQLNNKINPSDEARKRINQMERNQASSSDVLDTFISRMGLNRSPNADYIPSLGKGVSKGISHRLPVKNGLLSKENTDFAPKRVSLERISTNKTNVIAGKPAVSESSQAPSVTKGVPLEKKEKAVQLEPEVFKGLSDIKLLNSKKHITSKGRQENGNTHTKTKILSSTSSVSNKVGHSFGDTVSGRDESEPRKKTNKTRESQISPQRLALNKVAQSNTTRSQWLKNNKSLGKSGTSRVSSRTGSNDKNLLNHSKNGSHILALVNNTKLSTKPKDAFLLPLNSSISKHFNDLIKFLNSLESSSSKKTSKNTNMQGNSTSKKLLKFLDSIQIRKPNANFTSNIQGMAEGHNHSNHDSIAEENRKRIQLSIYKGWNEANKGKKLHHAMRFGTNDSSKKSKGNTFDLNVLQMIKNVSKKELLKLEGDIIKMLSSARLLNLSQQNGIQNPGQQHQISLEKLEEQHPQVFNRHHDKQDHLSEEQLNYHHQQQLHKQTQQQDMFQHRNLNVGQQQKENPTQGRKNQTNQQQIKDDQNGTTLRQYELERSGQSHLQETNQSRHFLTKMNMSNSTNSTTTVQNCTSLLPVNSRHLNYRCYQTYNRNSTALKNGSKVSFEHSSNTSQADSGTFNQTDFHVNTSHNFTFVTSPSVYHKSARKMTRLKNTSPFRTGNSTVVKRPSFNASSKEIDDIRNISIQLDRDSSQKVDDESIPEGKLGSGVVELTEFVDQVPDKENPITRWSEWTSCSGSCGVDAKKKRIQYRCTSSSQTIKDCAVSGEQYEACAFKPCPVMVSSFLAVDGRFLSWSRWSSCSRSCGFRGFSVRTRSCKPPKHGGQPCYGDAIDTRKCNRKHCPVNGGLNKWSKFGLCSKSCGGGVRMRHRECNNPVPRYGGLECDPGNLFETQSCGNMKCPAKTLKRLQVADVDPKTLCDFNPCEEAGCLHDPAARCITDFECNPVFFNADGDMLPKCKGMDNLYSRIPQVICSYNPCLSERCWEIRDQCVVDLKCRPVFIGIDRRSIPPQCQVLPLEQRPVTEVFIEKPPSNNDDDDDNEDDDDINEDHADEDDDDGNVLSDFDDDNK